MGELVRSVVDREPRHSCMTDWVFSQSTKLRNNYGAFIKGTAVGKSKVRE